MMAFIKSAQVLSISVSLIASGGIASLSLFDIPELQSQPASRSLPSIRWLFSRGSHIFPTASLLSTGGFLCLAYSALPNALRGQGVATAMFRLIRIAGNSAQVNRYLLAAALTFSIAPFTSLVMIPTNFRLIELNEAKGGARSEKAAHESDLGSQKPRSADESVDGKGQPSQWTDLSGPQTRTENETTDAENEEVRALLGKFGALNAVRAILMAAGGVAGLLAALT